MCSVLLTTWTLSGDVVEGKKRFRAHFRHLCVFRLVWGLVPLLAKVPPPVILFISVAKVKLVRIICKCSSMWCCDQFSFYAGNQSFWVASGQPVQSDINSGVDWPYFFHFKWLC